MNIYQKLSKARIALQKSDLKKSGLNKFAGFKYYELGDFIPNVNSINHDLGLLSVFCMNTEKACLSIINIDKVDETITFEIDVVKAIVKGATEIQAQGATQTYLKRYLYLNAYEIAEGEVIDAVSQDTGNNTKIKEQESQEQFNTFIKRIEEIQNVFELQNWWKKHKKEIDELEEQHKQALTKLVTNLKEKFNKKGE